MVVPEGGLCDPRPCLVWVMSIMWHNSSGGLTSSSLLDHPVFAPPIAITASSSLALGGGHLVLVGLCCVVFVGLCCVGLCPSCTGFSPVFR
jgi:hypothetical protein